MADPWVSNFGAYFRPQFCGQGSLVAGGAGDGIEIIGAAVDRLQYYSGKVVVAYQATLTEAKTLSIGLKRQQSADGLAWDAAEVVLAPTVKATGGAGGSVESGVVEFNEDHSAMKQYVRYNITPDLSDAVGVDVAIVSVTHMLGGADHLP